MPWLIKLALLLIQYGPAIYKIVKEILDLIKGLRADGDKEVEHDAAAFETEWRIFERTPRGQRDLNRLIRHRDRLRERLARRRAAKSFR